MATPEIATAYVSIVPSMQGFQQLLTRQIVAPAGGAGDRAGAAIGTGMRGSLVSGAKAAAAAAAVAAGVVLVKGISKAFEQLDVQNRLQAQLGATQKDAERYGDVAGKLYAKGITTNFQQGADAIKSIVEAGLVPPDATNKQIQSIAAKATDLANVFDEDLRDVTNAVSQLMRTGLAKNATQAFDLITKGFQNGTDKADDLLDTLNEYSTLFRSTGLSGAEAMGLMSQAIAAGARDSDKAADAIKEFSIRAVDGSKSTTEGFTALGLSAEDMAAKFGSGGKGANAVLGLTLDKLREMPDPVARTQAAVALFGTQAEDLGDALYAMDLDTAAADFGKFGGAAEKVGETIHRGPRHQIEVFKRTIEQGFVDAVGGVAIPAFNRLAASVAPLVGDLKDLVGSFSVDLSGSGLTSATADLREQLQGNLLPTVQDLGGSLRDDLAPAYREVGKALRKDVLPLWDRLASLYTGTVVPATLGLYRTIAGALQPGIETFANFLRTRAAPAVTYIGGKLQDLLTKAQPLIDFIVWYTKAWSGFAALVLSNVIPALIRLAGPIFTLTVKALGWVIDRFSWTITILGAVGTAIMTVGGWFQWLWDKAIQPVVSFIGRHIRTILAIAVIAIFGRIIAQVMIVGAIFKWLWNSAIKPTLQWIGDKAKWLWNSAIKPAFTWIRNAAQTTGNFLRTWLWDKSARPVFQWVGDKAKWLWDRAVKPAFDKIKTGTDQVAKAFDAGQEAIKIAWDKVKDIAKKPVAFVIETVYNKGIVAVWNKVASAFGAKKLDKIKGFATGGILPGYTPGRDVHLAALSGGEAVMRPEWTRAMGAGYVNSMNAAARSGGVGGVERLAQSMGLPAFKDGGVLGWVKNAGSAIKGVGSAAWDAVRGATSWLKDGVEASARAGVKAVVNPLIDRIPGTDTDFGKMVKRVPSAMLDALFGHSKKADKQIDASYGSAIGGSGVKRWTPVVLRALDMVGQPSSLLNTVLRRMNQESGGNPRAINNWDINAKNGTPSKGLMQVIDPTFRAYAGRLRNRGVWDPLANIYASMRYAMSRYGSLSAAYNRAGGYDSGGWLQPGATMAVNKTGKPEPILNPAQWRAVSTLANRGMEPGGLQPGDRLVLTVDGRTELEAVVQRGADREIRRQLTGPAARGRLRYA